MKRAFAILAVMVLGALVFAPMYSVAQLPQSYDNIVTNDFTVKDDSTGDTTFIVTDNTDSDTSLVYNSYLWEGLTMECYNDAPHADSAGVTWYVEGSLRGGTFGVIDSVNVTADATPTFGSTDLSAAKYRFIRFRVEGIATTDSSTVGFCRVMYWGQR